MCKDVYGFAFILDGIPSAADAACLCGQLGVQVQWLTYGVRPHRLPSLVLRHLVAGPVSAPVVLADEWLHADGLVCV